MAQLEFFSDRDLDGPRIAKDRADLRSAGRKLEQRLLPAYGFVARASIHGEIYAEGN
jgi:hypothetical protein